MTEIGNCPKCHEKVFVNYSEPGAWCHSENIPDGEYEEVCGNCGHEYLVVIDWSPRLYVEEKL